MRTPALGHLGHGPDVSRCGAAAAAYDVQPALLDKLRELAR